MKRRYFLKNSLLGVMSWALPSIKPVFSKEIILSKTYEIYDERMNELILQDKSLEKLATGATWSEGVAYVAEQNLAFWSDIPNNRLVAWTKDKGFFEFARPSHFANGHTIDLQGRIINCEHGRRCISRTVYHRDFDKHFADNTEILVDNWQGKRLNSPNDVVVKSDGTIWFTDPRYGILSNEEGYKAQSEIGTDNVYRFDPATNTLTMVIDDTIRPNGLAFSPDETLLYVSDTSASHDEHGRHEIRVYNVNADGDGVNSGKTFVTIEEGLPDGFRLDKHGNIFTSSEDSVQVFAPDGTRLGKILVPEKVANLTFGGDDFDELYIVASTSLYRIKLKTKADICRTVKVH